MKIIITNKLKSMKTFVAILTVISLFAFTSCKQEANVILHKQKIKKKKKKKEKKIVTNNEMMAEFMGKMKNNPDAMQMLQGDKEMMNMMMQGSGMQMMKNDMMKDGNMMEGMMQNMMKDGKMMNQMMQMMHSDGMMSETCMESFKKMMSDREMNMDMKHNTSN